MTDVMPVGDGADQGWNGEGEKKKKGASLTQEQNLRSVGPSQAETRVPWGEPGQSGFEWKVVMMEEGRGYPSIEASRPGGEDTPFC